MSSTNIISSETLNNGDYIFKYASITMNLVKLIINNSIWFSSLKSFNDPFESEFRIKTIDEVNIDAFANYFYSDYKKYSGDEFSYHMYRYQESPERLYSDLRDSYKDFLSKNYGITCFSSICNQLLMWSHYADSHKGVCLIFNKKKLYNGFKKKEIKIYEPKDVYINGVVEIETEFSENKASFKKKEDMLQHKSKIWEYEQEIRCIKKLEHESKSRNYKIEEGALEGIIFGDRTSEDDMNFISKLTDKIGVKLKYYKAKKDIENNTIYLIKALGLTIDSRRLFFD